MDFASAFILDDQEEEIGTSGNIPQEPDTSDEDQDYDNSSGLECTIMDFDEDEIETPTTVQETRVNTNTVKLDMKNLKEEPDLKIHESKLVTCKNEYCRAIYSHLSKRDDEKKVWTCNFCYHANDIESDLPDLSDKSDIMYIEDTSKIPELTHPESSKQKIIFVIDSSSSMSVTKPMEMSTASATLKDIIKTDKVRYYAQQQQTLNPSDLQFTGQVEVSRLQAFKSSVIDAIEKLRQSQPDTRVGLVTFHEDVTVYGDGSKVLTVQGMQLQNKKALEKIGEDERNLRPVHASVVSLKEKIAILNGLGRTALGPALVIAQAMAGDAEGSKVIVCTDGIANIGLGRLEDTTKEEINNFYNEVINDSVLSGVSVTLICVDNAGLDTALGQVPTETGGMLEKIQATELDAKLSEELSRATVAVSTDIKFVVHKDLYVCDTRNPDSKYSLYLQKIGNLQLDRPVSFSFAFKSSNPQEQPPPQATENGGQSLPFQIKVKYRNLAGVEVSRVWTAERKITRIRAQAEEAMNPKTAIENFIQQSSQNILDKIHSNRFVRDQALTLSNAGEQLLIDNGTRDIETVKNKLKQFIKVMNEIVNGRCNTEELIVELNRLKELRSSGVTG